MVEIAGSRVRALRLALGAVIVLLLAMACVAVASWIVWAIAGEAALGDAMLLDVGKRFAAAVACLAGAMIVACWNRPSLRLDPSSIIAPATLGCHESRRCVNLNTDAGPVRIENHYEVSLGEIRRRVNEVVGRSHSPVRSVLPSCGDADMIRIGPVSASSASSVAIQERWAGPRLRGNSQVAARRSASSAAIL